MYSICVIYK